MALGTQERQLVAVQVLDGEESTLPYTGTVRLAALEVDMVVETNADVTRGRYLEVFDEWTQQWTSRLASRAGRLLGAPTDDDPVDVVVRILGVVADTPA